MNPVNINARVEEVKNEPQLLNDFILQFKPFILSAAKEKLKKPFIDPSSDEFSVSLIAFAEAIKSYDISKGNFLGFAKIVIGRRLIDYQRKVIKYEANINNAPIGVSVEVGGVFDRFQEMSLAEYEKTREQSCLRDEIESLSAKLSEWGLTFEDIYKSCSKNKNTREFSNTVMKLILTDTEITRDVLTKRYLPIAKIECKFNLPRKKIEKLRNFIVMCIIINNGDFQYIKEFMK